LEQTSIETVLKQAPLADDFEQGRHWSFILH